MFYLEHKPRPPLDAAVRSLWYARDCDAPGGRQLVLPTGRAQFVISLARDFLMDCSGDGPAHAGAAAQVVGARSVYELIDASDLKDLIGVVFHPGGFPLMTREAADQFTNRGEDMEALWGAGARRLRSSYAKRQALGPAALPGALSAGTDDRGPGARRGGTACDGRLRSAAVSRGRGS